MEKISQIYNAVAFKYYEWKMELLCQKIEQAFHADVMHDLSEAGHNPWHVTGSNISNGAIKPWQDRYDSMRKVLHTYAKRSDRSIRSRYNAPFLKNFIFS